MAKVEQRNESSLNVKASNQLVSNTHVGKEYLSSCNGWVRPSSQTKCKTLLMLLQWHFPPKNEATRGSFDDVETKA